MPNRIVLLRRLDAGGYSASDLPIELIDVSHAAAVETLQTGLGARGWLSLFQDHLVFNHSRLVWRNDGMGAGRELKRSFSNILGRFFARNYLEEEVQVRDLVSIEGDHFRIPNTNFQIRRKGRAGDLPDWVGVWNNAPLIAEAKGSHDKRDWVNKQWPEPINTALRQIRRVEIVQVNSNGRIVPRTSRELFRGIAVGSKWGTQLNKASPVLIAVDADRKIKLAAPSNFGTGLAHAFQMQTLNGMGFEIDAARQRAREGQLVIVRTNGEESEPGVVSLLGWFGVFPIKDKEDVAVANILANSDQPVASVTFAPDALLDPELERPRRQYRGERVIRRGDVTVALLGSNKGSRIEPT